MKLLNTKKIGDFRGFENHGIFKLSEKGFKNQGFLKPRKTGFSAGLEKSKIFQRKIFLILMLVLLSSFALAQEIPQVENVFTEENFLKEIQKSYNEQRGDAPKFLISLFGNERLNIYINGIVVHAIMVNGEMTDIGTEEIDDPTMKVQVDKETVEKLMREEITLKQALDQDLIEYQGVGFGSKIKFGAVKAVSKIISWFT